MQVCDKCHGEGNRVVELSNGEKVKKPCYLCGGKGVLDGKKKVSKVKKIKKQSRPPVPERQASGQKPLSGLSAPLGDLGWMKGRKTHG